MEGLNGVEVKLSGLYGVTSTGAWHGVSEREGSVTEHRPYPFLSSPRP